MSLYEVVLTQQYANQQCINRWNYQSSGTVGTVLGAFGLVYAFGAIPDGTPPAYNEDSLLWKITLLQSVGNFYISILAKNIYDPTDFYDLPFPPLFQGQNTGESQSPVDAYGVRSSRVRTDIDRGTKRFSGVSESDVGSQGVLTSGGQAKVQAVADAMSATLTYTDEGSSLSFAPCIVKKEKYTTPRGNTAYRYYPTYTEQAAHLAVGVSWSIYTTVRSQTSRQYGRGA